MAPDSPGSLKTLATNDGVLRSGQDCVVAHVVDGPIRLTVLAYLRAKGDEVPQLRLDRVGLDESAAELRPASAARVAFEVPARGVSLIGHFERHGDVLALPGQWLGHPANNLRLEGFQIMWPDRPDDVALVSTVNLADRGVLPAADAGRFCGMRNVEARIVELTLALDGAGAAGLALDGFACFSGGYETPIVSGRALAGPSGSEHLTGLRMQVVRASRGIHQDKKTHT